MRSRVPQLDGIRGVAILLVVAWHYLGGPLGYHGGNADGGTLARGPLALCWCGVDLFFVLSGYLIADILLQARTATNYFTVFIIRRACRLLPLYAMTLLAFQVARNLLIDNVTLQPLFTPDSPPDWTYLIFAQNLGMASDHSFGPGWLAVTWSLAVEWQFYLVFLLMIRFAPPRILPWVAIGALLLGPMVRAMLPPVAGYVSLVSRADAFLAGALVAYLLREMAIVRVLVTELAWVKRIWCVLMVGVAVMSVRAEAFGAVMSWYGTFTHTWLALVFALTILIVLLDERWWLTRTACFATVRYIGVISYGIYLAHQPVNWLLHGLLNGSQPQVADGVGIGLTVLAGLGSLLLATVAYFTLEQRFIAVGRQVRYRYDPLPTDGLVQTPPPSRSETIIMHVPHGNAV